MPGFWRRWQEERALRRRAAAYIGAITHDPSDEDVRWLTTSATAGDVDHARWELRYARRSMGLLAAERDALDDRTGSLVARELAAALGRDQNIAEGKLAVAEKQFNARLRAYADALSQRGGEPTGARLGRALLAFAGLKDPPAPLVARAGDVLAAYLADANEALRREFGVASLPENLPPSATQGTSAATR